MDFRRVLFRSVPEPVRELFNFKEINWQKQNDVHYLLFNTGGSAGKLLNNATGMSDQEIIIDDIKKNISNAKSEIKRHKKNNEEHLKTTKRLKEMKKIKALQDANAEQLPVVRLSAPQEIDGSAPASVQSTVFNSTMIRVLAVRGTVSFDINEDPTATATSIAIAEGSELYLPVKEGEKIAIYNGIANVSECGE